MATRLPVDIKCKYKYDTLNEISLSAGREIKEREVNPSFIIPENIIYRLPKNGEDIYKSKVVNSSCSVITKENYNNKRSRESVVNSTHAEHIAKNYTGEGCETVYGSFVKMFNENNTEPSIQSNNHPAIASYIEDGYLSLTNKKEQHKTKSLTACKQDLCETAKSQSSVQCPRYQGYNKIIPEYVSNDAEINNKYNLPQLDYIDLTSSQVLFVNKVGRHEKEPLLNISLAGKEYDALLDTGSSISLIGDAAIKHIKSNNFKIIEEERPLKLAAGKTLYTGRITLKIRWKGGEKKQMFLLLPGLCHSVILGRDFLHTSGMSLHIAQRGWTLGNTPQKIVPFSKVKTPEAAVITTMQQND
jgi:predicted aspartyl protease